jgi:isoleucyl-tRNA synthetase
MACLLIIQWVVTAVMLKALSCLQGEHVFKANEHVIEVLKEHDALVKDAKFTHSYPVCWRHKTPIIFRATPQWFIGMSENGLRDAAMTEIKQVQWLP